MIITALLFLILFFLIQRVREHQNYFKKQNVKYFKSWLILGALKDSVLKKITIVENFDNIYNAPELKDEPYFGIFTFYKPGIVVKDPELIKRILVTDFQSFNSRHSESGVHDPLGYYHPFLSDYSIWKNVRPNISKFFTASKLKSSFYLMEKLGEDLSEFIDERLENNQAEISAKFVSDLFTVDVISSIALGVEANSLKNSGSEFYKVATSMWESTLKRSIELLSILIFPELGKLIKSTIMGKYADDFLYEVAPKIIAEREKSGQKRNDLIDILIEMKKNVQPEHPSHTVDHILISQIATFLQAGYETASATTSFALYELAKNPEIQKTLRNEIKDVLKKNEGKVSYEVVAFQSESPYLHQVISETLRLYQPVPTIQRKCTNPEGYSLGKFKIPFGMTVSILSMAQSKDEKYFPDPLKFKPERFSKENSESFPTYSYLPFGAGKRDFY